MMATGIEWKITAKGYGRNEIDKKQWCRKHPVLVGYRESAIVIICHTPTTCSKHTRCGFTEKQTAVEWQDGAGKALPLVKPSLEPVKPGPRGNRIGCCDSTASTGKQHS